MSDRLRTFTAIYVAIGGGVVSGFIGFLFLFAGGFASDSGSSEALSTAHTLANIGTIAFFIGLVLSVVDAYLILRNKTLGWVLSLVFSTLLFLIVVAVQIIENILMPITTLAVAIVPILSIKGLRSLRK